MNSFEQRFAKDSFEWKFAETYPYLWHLTAVENIERIESMERKHLDCAATILHAAGCDKLIRAARTCCLTLCVNGEMVILRNHYRDLCNPKKVEFTHGWILEDYIEYLNGFVFFFPGEEKRPIKAKRFFGIYKQQQALCIPTKSLFMANLGTPPQFSCCNSGAPTEKKPFPHKRGPDTFVCGEEFEGDPSSDVFEVAFCCKANLPDSLEVRCYEDITWD